MLLGTTTFVGLLNAGAAGVDFGAGGAAGVSFGAGGAAGVNFGAGGAAGVNFGVGGDAAGALTGAFTVEMECYKIS